MNRIILTNAEGDQGRIVTEAGESFGPLPPQDGPTRALYERLLEEGVVPELWQEPPPAVPDGPSLADWRVALDLWGRLEDVIARVTALRQSKVPAQAGLGKVAWQQLEYSNFVQRDRLMQIRAAFGFSVAEVDESLWRASRIAEGDYSGTWPLAA